METQKKFIVVVNGPTASGKTTCAIEIAKQFGGEIISADSRQFYREMRIGTAKPSQAEQAQARHHLIDSLSIHDPFTAGDFERAGLLLIDEIAARGRLPIVCGGSGLYIKALLQGLDTTEVPQDIRDAVRDLFASAGLDKLQREVKSLDPVYFASSDVQNPVRMMRALELLRATGLPMAQVLKGTHKPRNFTPIKIGLDLERSQLYGRINARVDEMMAEGFEAEARGLHPHKDLQSLQTVGYKELFDHFEGVHPLQRTVELIKQNTRRYAKRQLTWLRKEQEIAWFHPEHTDPMVDFLRKRL